MEVSANTALTRDETIEKRPHNEAMELALAVDSKVAKEHARWWHPGLNPKVGGHLSPVAEGVDGAISARVAEERDRVLGLELSPAEEEQHAELVAAAKVKELADWKKFRRF